MRKGNVALVALMMGMPVVASAQATAPSGATGKFTATQYRKALWMATRYFGAMRSGKGPNWVLQDSKYPTSFVKDSIPGRSVEGGWYDCGDHVMFGQTQYYAAYVLAKAYATFPKGFHDDYTGDYSDYKASQNYAMAGGKANGIADLLEELRYEADFFVKATPNADTFVVQKGKGTLDHQYWVDAGYMSSLPIAKGGESDGSRTVYVNPQDGGMPALCAATLAIMARVDPDATRRATYLEHAKYAYAYSQKYTGTSGSPEGSFYSANSTYPDGVVNGKLDAAVELWLTTNDASYKTAATTYAATVGMNYGYRMDYANPGALGVFNAKYVLKATLRSVNETNLTGWLQQAYSSTDASNGGVSTKSYSSDFPLRDPEAYSFLSGLVQTAGNTYTKDVDQFVFNQIDYILGSNSKNRTYLLGWDEGSKTQPEVIQSRNYYMNEDVSKSQTTARTVPAKNKYFGAVVPGALDGSYTTDIDAYSKTEACLEQNAPFVGALGYIVSLVDSVSASTGISKGVVRTADELSFTHSAGSVGVVVIGTSLVSGEAYDLSGRRVASLAARETGLSLSTMGLKSGLYLVRVRTAEGQSLSHSVMVY